MLHLAKKLTIFDGFAEYDTILSDKNNNKYTLEYFFIHKKNNKT